MSAQDNDTPRNLFREISKAIWDAKDTDKPVAEVWLSSSALELLQQAPEFIGASTAIPDTANATTIRVKPEWQGVVVEYVTEEQAMNALFNTLWEKARRPRRWGGS